MRIGEGEIDVAWKMTSRSTKADFVHRSPNFEVCPAHREKIDDDDLHHGFDGRTQTQRRMKATKLTRG